MHFNFAEWIMNPFVLMMLTVFSGMLFGKINLVNLPLAYPAVFCRLSNWVVGLQICKHFFEHHSRLLHCLAVNKNGVVDKGFLPSF